MKKVKVSKKVKEEQVGGYVGGRPGGQLEGLGPRLFSSSAPAAC